MRKQLLAGVSVVALAAASPAFAAPPLPALYNWTGAYAGGNIGYSWGSTKSNFNDNGFTDAFGPGGFCCDFLPSSFPTSLKPNGVIGGFQVGYNWQVSPSWIFGIEGDLNLSAETARTSFSNSYDCEGPNFSRISCTLSQTRSAKIHWFDTLRARVGWLITPTTFVYGTGGLAFGRVSFTGTVTDDANNTGASFSFHDSDIKAGFAVGTGIEGAFANWKDWTWKVEYLYVDLGSLKGNGLEPITGNFYSWDAKFIDNIVRVGFNYRFH
jgi:outer membrane immunogenic protein